VSLSILYVSAARRLGWSADVLDMPAHVLELVGHMAAPCPFDHVSRRSYAPAPKMRWASDLTYVATRSDFVYVTLVIDTYAKRIVGWRVSRATHASCILDALEQALHDRRPARLCDLIRHNDCKSQSRIWSPTC
jgi:transposase InsO family protein